MFATIVTRRFIMVSPMDMRLYRLHYCTRGSDGEVL